MAISYNILVPIPYVKKCFGSASECLVVYVNDIFRPPAWQLQSTWGKMLGRALPQI